MRKLCAYVLCLSFLWGINPCGAEDVAVIVNRANVVDTLSLAQLASIYKGQLRQWPDGRQIVVVNRPEDSFVRKAFYKEVLHSTSHQKFFLLGSPIPFSALLQRSSRATIRFVANLPEAVGYLFLDELELDEKSNAIKISSIITIENRQDPASEDIQLDK